jgi:hypothetical protein
MRPRNELALLPKVPVLITESADEFDALRDAFEREIKPRGIIEQMYVHDICAIVWEILRLAVQGGHHQFGLPQRIGRSSRAAKAARPTGI